MAKEETKPAPKQAASKDDVEKRIVAEALLIAAGKHHSMDLVKLCQEHPDYVAVKKA